MTPSVFVDSSGSRPERVCAGADASLEVQVGGLSFSSEL